MAAKIPITITHPRSSRPFEANVAPECTARMVLENLQQPDITPDGPFLDPAPADRPYVLTSLRTGKALAPETTMAQARMKPNDMLAIEQIAAGA